MEIFLGYVFVLIGLGLVTLAFLSGDPAASLLMGFAGFSAAFFGFGLAFSDI
jgi:hypothetical protein